MVATSLPLPRATAAPVLPTGEGAGNVTNAYYEAWQARDYRSMYGLLSAQSRARIDERAFVERHEEVMDVATARSLGVEQLSLVQEDNNAEIGVRLSWETILAGNFTRDYTVPLVFEDGRWAIIWNDGLILPELAGGNRLTMEIRTPSRAAIYDRQGQPLAYQGTILSLGVVPGQIEDEDGLLEALSPVLGLTPEEIQTIYAPFQPVGLSLVQGIQAPVVGRVAPTKRRPVLLSQLATPIVIQIVIQHLTQPFPSAKVGAIPAEQL